MVGSSQWWGIIFFSSDICGISCMLFCNCTAASHYLTQWINNQVMQLHSCTEVNLNVMTPWRSGRSHRFVDVSGLVARWRQHIMWSYCKHIYPSRWGGSNLWLVGILEQLLNWFSRSYFILFSMCAFQLAFQRANQHHYIISSGSICMKNKM